MLTKIINLSNVSYVQLQQNSKLANDIQNLFDPRKECIRSISENPVTIQRKLSENISTAPSHRPTTEDG